MSIEEGGEVITVEGKVGEVTNPDTYGGVHVSFSSGVGYSYHEKKLAKVDDPLRVRVDSEQEAREVLDEARDSAFRVVCSTDLHNVDGDSRSVVHFMPEAMLAQLEHLADQGQGIWWSDRPAQVEAYIEHHTEEKTMSDDDRQRENDDLTHDPVEGYWQSPFKCKHCGERRKTSDEPCPARQPAEDDDHWEGDVKRRLAKEILSGDTSLVGAVTVNKLNLYERAIRDHCELSDGVSCSTCGDNLTGEPDHHYHTCQNCSDTVCDGCVVRRDYSTEVDPNRREILCQDCDGIYDLKQEIRELKDEDDGVCEWSKDGDTVHPECHEADYGIKIIDIWNFCPGCKGEITTDEGGEYRSFEMGDVIYVKQKDTYHLVREPSVEFPVIGEDEEGRAWCEDSITYDIEKVGSFVLNDDALERVNPECNGSLFVADDKVLFDPLCRTEDIEFSGSELLFTDEGRGYQVQGAEATGIVLESFHQIAEVQDESK